MIESTQLIAGDTVYEIAKAEADRHYDSILGRVIDKHDKWGFRDTWVIPGVSTAHFEAGYSEGKAGGKLLINAYETLLNGTLDGSTTTGIYQRDPATQAPGSTLSIDLSNNNLLGKQDVAFNQDANIADISASTVIPRDAASDQPIPLTFDAGLFQRSGISHVNIKTNGTVSLQKGARIDLPNAGSLNLAATGFNIQGSIIAPSGSIALNPVTINELLMPSPITLGADALLDVSGLWVNDALDGAAGAALKPLAIAGGSVTLAAEQGDLRLEQESQIKANGGRGSTTKASSIAAQAEILP
jgi:filamentous hemagglutinin